MKTSRSVFIAAAIAAMLLFLFACDRQYENVVLPDAPTVSQTSRPVDEYTIRQGDKLEVKFFYNPELNETVTVRPDGMITLQLLDDVRAEGRTPAELDAFLTEAYSQELQKPVVTVIVRTFSGRRVFVGGEVRSEGILTLTSGMTPLQAVYQAGGFRDSAAPEAAILIRKGAENEPVMIKVDLKKARRGEGPAATMAMQPDDIIYVPKKFYLGN
jgi:polysaccharide export outer membrane protein